jgi:endonuclease I/fibronectin type 3 domain-containing protein
LSHNNNNKTIKYLFLKRRRHSMSLEYQFKWRYCAQVFIGLLIYSSTIYSQAPPGYYSSADTTDPNTLRNTLHQIIDDHTRFPYTSSSTDTWNVLEIADEDMDNSGKIITVYENDSNAKVGGGNTNYNREHSWPKSYGFPNDGASNYPYTDMHHLFLADSGYNSSRNNKPYDYCISGCSEKVTLVNNSRGGPGQSNWTAGSNTDGIWQVWQGRKGDVARALFYMDVRYEGGNHGITGYSEPDLILTDNLTLIENSNTGSNISTAYMGLLSVLITWHNDDPVDIYEQQHNEAVASFQGNRNPFVDHPEWVECVFELNCNGGGSDTTAPNQVTGLSASSTSNSVSLDWYSNTESDLAGYNVYRSTSSTGSFSKINSSLIVNSAYQDNSVSSSTNYYYRVTASDTSGNESVDSNSIAIATGSSGGGIATAWINEFHYDNSGTDRNEFVEIAGIAGTDLTGWTIEAYNGGNGSVYDSVSLSGIISDQQECIGTKYVNFSGLQNGAPDGLALVDSAGNVLDFISYEGTLVATDGSANGMTSNDIGVSESSSSSRNNSLQLGGTGASVADFSWQNAIKSTKGSKNTNQTFNGCGADVTAPAAPANLVATAEDAQVTLIWNANSENDLAGYNLLRSINSGGPYTQVNGTLLTDTMYMDSAVNNDTTYYYVVTAIDTNNNISASSNQVNATPVAPVISEAVWINEIHYDNASTDIGEFVEIAGTSGSDLTGWQLLFYNGTNGLVYKTVNLAGVIANQQSSFGVIAFDVPSIQNGAPDGLALVDPQGIVMEFLSYEGTLTAFDGAANGMTSVDIGVSETTSTPVGYSLQRTGSGVAASDFVFTAAQADTYGTVNTGQSF